MDRDEKAASEDRVVTQVNHTQMAHFARSDSNCRVLRMPDGVLLRYTQHPSLYFFLTSENVDGNVVTRIFASDSAYERQKIKIGDVKTPMFDQPLSEPDHLKQVEGLLRSWVDFTSINDSIPEQDFKVLGVKDRQG
jgi:hypothetical protein